MRKAAKLTATIVMLAIAAPAAAGFLEAFTGALTWTVELAVLLADKKPRLKGIYLSHFGTDGPVGTIHPKIAVGAGGTVQAVTLETDTIGHEAFAEAIRQEILTWEMPESTWTMEVGFDLEFDPGRDLYGADVEVEK